MSSPKRDITGVRFGRLVAAEYCDNSQWKCMCDCGKTTVVRTCNLTNGHTRSCGCAIKEQSAKNGRKSLIDLTGQRFGKLTVISYHGDSKWVCRCDCGSTTVVSQNNLCRKNRGTKSCGCLQTLDAANGTNIVCGTNIGNIKTDKALPQSSTGIRGVHYSKSQGVYVATIGFRGKQYTLCTSHDINVCIATRKESEMRIFGSFLEWYENEVKGKNNEDD